jgi:putative transposase
MATQGFPVQVCCRVLEVSPSGYYAWRSRAPSVRAIRHAWLTDVICQVHAAVHGTYGSRRVHAELTLGRGITVGDHAVELLMRRAGLRGVTGRPKFRRGLRPEATAVDLVNRQFAAPAQTRSGSPTPPSTRPAKAGCTAPSSWTPAHGGWSAGRSTPPRPQPW